MNQTEASILTRLYGHAHSLGPGIMSGTPGRKMTRASNRRELRAALKLEEVGLVRVRCNWIYRHLYSYENNADVPNRHPDKRDRDGTPLCR